MTSFMNRWSGLEILGLILLAPALALSQVKSAAQRLLDAEEKIAELESRDKKRAKELDEVKAQQTLSLPGGRQVTFPIDGFARACLLKGVDELGYLLSFADQIAAYEAAR